MTYLKLSPSKVGTWIDCPRRYFHTYVEHRRSTTVWAHFSFGNSIHAALRDWFELPAEKRTEDQVAPLVTRVWIEGGYRDSEHAAQWRDRAVQMVATYVRELDPRFEPLSTERTLAFKTDSLILQGRIDRIDEHEGRVRVIDYKTGKSAPSTDDVRGSLALALYALMVQRALGRTCFDVSLHHLPSGGRVVWTHTPESLQRQLDRVDQIGADIVLAQDTWDAAEPSDRDGHLRDVLFPARPSALCGYCDHWDMCEVGQSFSERRQSWAGLPVDSD